MAFDAAPHRLFVVARRPARLLVFDSDSGRIVAHLPAVARALGHSEERSDDS
jgi:hypothetical protein